MELSLEAKRQLRTEPARFLEQEIKTLVQVSAGNRLPALANQVIFDEPLVQFADGDAPIFTEYKTVIASTHLTPREALAKSCGRSPEGVASRLSVISWILPIARQIRESNRQRTKTPSHSWSDARQYGEQFNDTIREHLVELLTGMGYLAVAPVLPPHFQRRANEKGPYSNWSERHIAYAAGLGTFSLSDGFITERGIAHRCGSVVTDLVLPASLRLATVPYANCLFYVDGSCRACIVRCPAGAITETGHDKIKCQAYIRDDLGYLKEEYKVDIVGCGLCQVKVPCESQNPTKKLKKKKG